jgi:hypothetical protein
MKKFLAGSIVLSSFLFAGGAVEPMVVEEPVVETKAWSFELEPYMMVTNIYGTSTLSVLPTSDVDVDFKNILDNLDMALMVHVEAHHQSGWGMWIDYGFMDLSNGVEDYPAVTSVSARQGVLEVMGLYRQTLSSGYIEYLAGIRWWDNDLGLDVVLNNQSYSRVKKVDWVDAVVGFRYTHILNENWKFRMHGDIGGGGADITYAATAGVIYTINDLMDVDVKYKATWVDYEEGTPVIGGEYFSYDTVTHGVVLGLNFKF